MGFIDILLEKNPKPSSQRGLWNGSACGTRTRLVITVSIEVSDRRLFFFSMPKEASFPETGFPDTGCEDRCCRLVHLYDYGLPFLRRLD